MNKKDKVILTGEEQSYNEIMIVEMTNKLVNEITETMFDFFDKHEMNKMVCLNTGLSASTQILNQSIRVLDGHNQMTTKRFEAIIDAIREQVKHDNIVFHDDKGV